MKKDDWDTLAAQRLCNPVTDSLTPEQVTRKHNRVTGRPVKHKEILSREEQIDEALERSINNLRSQHARD